MGEAIASASVGATAGLIVSIPVRNLWLLMLYASELFRCMPTFRKVAIEANPDDIADLVAEVLSRMVERRLRRNLTFGYLPAIALLGRVRGRIDVLRTERFQLLMRGKVACRFEDLTVNTSQNRHVRGALCAVSRVVRRRDLAHRCQALSTSLGRLGVSGEVPTRPEMSTVHRGRVNANDRLMVAAADLAYALALPTEMAGDRSMARPGRDIAWVRRLYEKAVGGFYDIVLSPRGWHVKTGQTLGWLIERKTSGIDGLLPAMRTDIVLTHVEAGRRIVIDTKFTSILTKGWFRDDVLRSGYLYQIYAYLRSQEGKGDPVAEHASGLLLHPSVGETIDETVVIQGHAIRFGTVDLAASAREIREQLVRLIEDPDGRVHLPV